VLCFRVEAQQPNKVPRVGYLGSGSRSSAGAGFTSGDVEAFRQGLRDLGYIEGQNITIGYRYAEGMAERLPNLAAELVQLKVDIIVVGGSPALKLRRIHQTIPIVMTNVTDLVENRADC
jgi:putative tryptophan/tyrosine transport system substrate-binding protein